MSQSFTREAARRLLHVSEKQLKSWEQQKLVLPASSYGFRELLALRTHGADVGGSPHNLSPA